MPATITLSPKPKKIVCAIANGNTFTIPGTPIPYDAAVLVNANNFQFTITSAVASGTYLLTWFANRYSMNNNFLIGTIDNGIQKNVKPWAIINSAFANSDS